MMLLHRMRHIILFSVISAVLLAGWPAGQVQAQPEQRCFNQTGYCMAGRIREFWEQNGGIDVFGLPITPQQAEPVEGQMRQVQWFERARLELHPENPAPFDVLLGHLGTERLRQTGRDWLAVPRNEPRDGCLFFAETGQNICGAILAAWRANGLELDRRAGKSIPENLALFGLPLTDAQTETLSNGQTYTVQWFERARFELHPANTPPYNVLLGLLGNELRGRDTTSVPISTARFEPGACPFGVPGDMRVECGYLTVPEERGHPTGPTVQLAVAIVRTGSPNPAPDPVVYLSGGPGSAALMGTIGLARGWSRFLANRDFIVLDQRGTGLSRPALTCPEVFQANDNMLQRHVSRAEKVQIEVEALLRCRDRLEQEGVNLAAYHSAASAADLEDLRIALGYKQWNLFGISYGTRLALTAMRDYPASIRSVVLDSVYPPQVNLYTDMPANANRAFTTLFQGCARHSGCNTRHPNLEDIFYATVERLNTNPVTVYVHNPRTGGTMPAVFDGSRLISLLFSMLYNTDVIPQLPRMIYDTYQGNYTLLSQMEARRLGRQGGFSHAMYFSVQCSEEIAFATPEEVYSTVAAFPRLSTFFSGILENTPSIFTLCSAWGVYPPDPIENQPVQSDIPTLLLTGEYDPITPPEWGRLAAQTLRTGFHYEFAGTGHAVVTRGTCPYGMIQAFLNNPTVAPAGECAAALGGPPF